MSAQLAEAVKAPPEAKTYILTLDELGEAVAAYLTQRHGWKDNVNLEWGVDVSKVGPAGTRVTNPTYITVTARLW